MDPAAAVKRETRFFSFSDAEIIGGGRSAGIRSGNSTCGESEPPASAEILQAEWGSRPLCTRAGRLGAPHDGSTMDPKAAVKGETRFSRKFLDAQHGSGGEGISRPGNPACAKSSGGRSRCATRGERGRLPLRVRRGGRLHAPSRRIHDGSNGGSGPGSRSSPFRMRNLQRSAGRPSPGREIPHAPQTRSPRLPKHGKRSGRGATGDQMEGKGGVRMRSSAAPGAYAHAGHA